MFSEFVNALKFAGASLLVTLMLLWALERATPRTPVTWSTQLRSIRYWLIYLLISAVTATAFANLIHAAEARRLFVIPFGSWLRSTPLWWSVYVIGPLVGMLVYDFFNYWMHRVQHKWFWRQHAVHHSIEQLSAINSYFHPTEDLFRIAFITIPMALVGVDTGVSTLASVVVVGAYGNYLHSASRFNLGAVGRHFLADNVYHRVHHSAEERHFDVNFATATPIWDVLFGTVYWPERDEWPATGVHDAPEPGTVLDFLCRPFVAPASVDSDGLEDARCGASIRHGSNPSLIDRPEEG